ATATPDPSDTPEPSATPEPTSPPEPTATPRPEPLPIVTNTPTEEPVAAGPAPTLFETAWTDRTPFEAGLISTEQDILNELPGASVYHIDLVMADDIRHLSGVEEVLYTNREAEPLEEVFFRLFPNLAGGSSVISDLTVNDTPVEPEFSLNSSAMRVPLAEPLEPGDSVVIRMRFEIEAPNGEGGNYGTFAYVNEALALAHFYPMIAVYDDEGWNVEIAPPIGDVIYADTSFYLVRITAPAEQVVLTSGIEIEREESGDRQILTIAAGPMRDFYLASGAAYEVVSATVGETTINSYAPADLKAGAELALQQTVDSFASFNERFGVYPYTEFDVITTTTFALGIEYPGIVAILIDLYELEGQVAGASAPVLLEAVVAHEAAHQWFYGLVGNDQVDEPWLDEALAQYLTMVYYADVYGENGRTGFRGSLERRWQRVEGADIPVGLPVSDYTAEEYGAIVYGRGPLFIEALAAEMGQDVFDDFILDYSLTYRWQIATAQDFQTLAEQYCECDLTPLFEEWVY
ncbi:MAG: M1 family metallopeptidase, partial [Anaerolineae bacterium]|nr:M1 family metallopeptidase [Anaerolineae bacterium]